MNATISGFLISIVCCFRLNESMWSYSSFWKLLLQEILLLLGCDSCLIETSKYMKVLYTLRLQQFWRSNHQFDILSNKILKIQATSPSLHTPWKLSTPPLLHHVGSGLLYPKQWGVSEVVSTFLAIFLYSSHKSRLDQKYLQTSVQLNLVHLFQTTLQALK